MHTKNRLEKYKILDFKDEICLQESKFLWRWNNKTLPRSLHNIVVERRGNLRGRRFDISNQKKGVLPTVSLNKPLMKSTISLLIKLLKPSLSIKNKIFYPSTDSVAQQETITYVYKDKIQIM